MAAYLPPLDGRDPKSHSLLDFNERTVPVSGAIEQALVDYIQQGRLQMYPAYGDVVEQIAAYAGVEAAQLMITNGSDQGIDLVFRAACSPGDEVIIPKPSFAMYFQCAHIENTQIISPFYDEQSGYPEKAVFDAISDKTRVIVISNPNNPCGTLTPESTILRIAQAAPHAAILVDECYFEYCGLTVKNALNSHPNIIVARTFSKTWGIPSLRLGYLMSCAENIQSLLRVRGPYDINQLAVVAIEAALQNQASIKQYIDEVMAEAKPLFEAFLRQSNVRFWASSANFIWMFPENPLDVEAYLRDHNILVRPKQDGSGLCGLRVTVGTRQQVDALIKCLAECPAFP